MHRWVKKTYSEVLAGQYQRPYKVQIHSKGDAQSVELDLSDIPTPEGSFWLE
jgi:hypothetical protein